jgi:hypothetical protein
MKIPPKGTTVQSKERLRWYDAPTQFDLRVQAELKIEWEFGSTLIDAVTALA